MLVDKPLRQLLADFASARPVPGGGSAAAVGSAIGAALLVMVSSLPKSRTGSEDDRTALAGVAATLTAIQHQLTEEIDADAAAYAQVVAAYRLPKASDAERAARTAAIQRALRGATDVPLGVMRLSAAALRHATTVAAHVYRPAASDARVGVALLAAAVEGAGGNVDANLGAIHDAAYVGAVRLESRRLLEQGAAARAEAERLLA